MNGVYHWSCAQCGNKRFFTAEKFVRHAAEKHGTDVSGMFDQPIPDDWLSALPDDRNDRSRRPDTDRVEEGPER